MSDMPKPYSNDLRARVMRFYEEHSDYTQAELAAEFEVSLSTLEKWLQRWRASGSCAALPPGGGRTASLAKHQRTLHKLVAAQPDATLGELQSRLAQRRRVVVSQATVCRALQRLQLRRKKSPKSPASNGVLT